MFEKLKRYRIWIYVFPILLSLSACNDSKDDQANQQPDTSKKPVMRCAP